ncbi:uncharacterized protein N7459_008742 [Penicillium hispanicum]|uniref:uncharacterized protein n=1 Tax=Penicillium hispanicum TaxID=1080232 RepID=UPI0025423D8E|nr:uncharacterized protein N7459_008742 [Penicillium hispanicum]KAJ5574315.1 hypothetical protein N7459_008742 [Penicillium hispanicum]
MAMSAVSTVRFCSILSFLVFIRPSFLLAIDLVVLSCTAAAAIALVFCVVRWAFERHPPSRTRQSSWVLLAPHLGDGYTGDIPGSTAPTAVPCHSLLISFETSPNLTAR